MQNGSHSRNSYPLDKMVPKTIIRGTNKDRVPPGATIKKMHKKKQRQYNVEALAVVAEINVKKFNNV